MKHTIYIYALHTGEILATGLCFGIIYTAEIHKRGLCVWVLLKTVSRVGFGAFP